MSDLLDHIYNACDPLKPASEDFYVNCAEARGDNALTLNIQNHLRHTDAPLRFLVSGHIGCGKSSELLCLKRALENPYPTRGRSRYFTIFLDAHEYLDEFDVSYSDILLAIVAEVAHALRLVGIELKDSYWEKRVREVQGFLLTDIEPTEAELALGGAKVKIKPLKADPDARKQVREQLQPRITSMLEEINIVLSRARVEVQKLQIAEGETPYSDIVLILDGLEKIRRVDDKAEGAESHRELFVERAPQLTRLHAHVIYTVPLSLARSDGPQLLQRYGTDPIVLPMVKVFSRGHQREPYDKGIEFLTELLQRRLGGSAMDEAFDAEALKFLRTYSGGHVRNLLTFVREACTYTEMLPIALPAAKRAIQKTLYSYSVGIEEAHWEKLAQLDASDDQKIANDDADYLKMLENLSVLEYINGDSGADSIVQLDPWYAVNPIVRELPKFKTTAQRLAAPQDE